MCHVYVNVRIDEKDKDVIKEKDVRDGLEEMYIASDRRYSHFRKLGRSSFVSASSSGPQTFPSMWNQEENSETCTNDLDRYIVDRVLFCPKEKANIDVLGWWKAISSTFFILSVIVKDLANTTYE